MHEPDRRFLTTTQAARILCVSPSTLARWSAEGGCSRGRRRPGRTPDPTGRSPRRGAARAPASSCRVRAPHRSRGTRRAQRTGHVAAPSAGGAAPPAIIEPSGRIVWWCLPRYDGDPVFCRLVAGSEEKGFTDVVVETKRYDDAIAAARAAGAEEARSQGAIPGHTQVPGKASSPVMGANRQSALQRPQPGQTVAAAASAFRSGKYRTGAPTT